MNLNGVEYYYIRNAQNGIIGLFDNDGNQVASYIYDSWGKLISIKDGSGADITNDTGSVGYKNPYRYRGYRYDTETGLYYLQSRYYNPDWGRLINEDELIGQTGELLAHNMFAYCKNNPVNMTDTNGDFPWLIIIPVITALTTWATAVLSSPDINTDIAAISTDIQEGDKTALAIDLACAAIPVLPAGGGKLISKASKVTKSISKSGRSGKQARLRQLANDDKVSSAIRGTIKRDINEIKLGKRKNIRVPEGFQLAHKRGFEARKGFGYEYSDLQTTKNHWTQHKFDKYGRR